MLSLLLNDRIKKRKRPRLFHFLRLPSLRLLLLLVNNWKRLCVYERLYTQGAEYTRTQMANAFVLWYDVNWKSWTNGQGDGSVNKRTRAPILARFFFKLPGSACIYIHAVLSSLFFPRKSSHKQTAAVCRCVWVCTLLVGPLPSSESNQQLSTHSLTHAKYSPIFFFLKRERRSRRRGKRSSGVCVCV